MGSDAGVPEAADPRSEVGLEDSADARRGEKTRRVYFSCFDANGNVTAYVDEDGSNVAHYVYSPFGSIIGSAGVHRDLFPIRFSTKYRDGETGLLYYGYRFHSPGIGRWLSRDPLMEISADLLYQFVANDPIRFIDPVGLSYTEHVFKKKLPWIMEHFGAGVLGYTDSVLVLAGRDEVDGLDACCATVREGLEFDLTVISWVPSDGRLVPGGPEIITPSGMTALAGHEARRREVYKLGYDAYLAPAGGNGAAVHRCGEVCRRERGEAAQLLLQYLASLRAKARTYYNVYTFIEQMHIAGEMPALNQFGKPGWPVVKLTRIHTINAPAPPEWPDCPVSNAGN